MDLPTSNALLAPYGLSFDESMTAASTVSRFYPHPITAGVNTIETIFGATVGVSGSAIDLTVAGGTSDILAVSAAPYRVVAFGDTNTFTGIAAADNAKLAINIANFTAVPEPSVAGLVIVAIAARFSVRRRKSA